MVGLEPWDVTVLLHSEGIKGRGIKNKIVPAVNNMKICSLTVVQSQKVSLVEQKDAK